MPRKAKEKDEINLVKETKKVASTSKKEAVKNVAKKASNKSNKKSEAKTKNKIDSKKELKSKIKPESKNTSKKQTKSKVDSKKQLNTKSQTKTKTNSKKQTNSKEKETAKTKTKSDTNRKSKLNTKTNSKTNKKINTNENTKTKKKAKTNTAKKSETTKKVTKTKASTKSTKVSSTKKKIEIIEYYDLPYRYNQTVVKLLTQTPNTLFVYWDISDKDKENYIKQYGEYFFNNTKPVLVVHNKSKNYSFEIDINDFANSWYLHVEDSNCEYKVELGRRPINEYVQIDNNYLYITNSNDMVSQNDHILFEKLSHLVYFRNVKTGQLIKKDINLSLLTRIGKITNVKEFYKKLYPNEDIDFKKLNLKNPTSNSSIFM